MDFDANTHRCTILIDQQLPAGLAMNAASIIGISFGKLPGNLVGPNQQSQDGVDYPGVIYAPLAQSCKTYEEYGERIADAHSDQIELVAIGLIGPKKKITLLTGNLKLYR
ncbi:DUF2000 domain-containing protein [Pantoea sp. GbtcB22]|uniref:DUF2000 domain-containing protein n=1 Tax=Pantoea sp. GbtcB22 TaxID=2824767 RepID=UPI001C2F9054|nr:DUF2000 domain-containing protein [Pantoea sp. GbtcB22]